MYMNQGQKLPRLHDNSHAGVDITSAAVELESQGQAPCLISNEKRTATNVLISRNWILC